MSSSSRHSRVMMMRGRRRNGRLTMRTSDRAIDLSFMRFATKEKPAPTGSAGLTVCRWGRLVRSQLFVQSGVADGALDLVEGTHLDLAHALAADAELLGQVLERGRLVLEAALRQDAPLARIEQLQRAVQQLLPAAEFLAFGQHRLLAVGLVDQPFLPFAFAVHAHRR